MALAAGTKLGIYEILALIGAGGMGEVYRARDTRLKRDVALKVLPDAVAGDADRMARFQREAEALAALNHPNIAQIYGVEERALAMELVEGETLAQIIAQGPVPVDTALQYAKQLGDALEAAHEKGIVHRDLKPANVMITAGGSVKVLDFGLAAVATAFPAGASGSGAINSPTLTMRATEAGLIMGTAAYMSPEQARGKVVDKRADIWAFGVVLYEMLSGEKLFEGDTFSDTMAAVLRHEPDWKRIPAKLQRLVKSCLEKDSKLRLRDIGDAWRLIGVPVEQERARDSALSRWAPWMVAACAGIAGLAIAWVHFREPAPAAPQPMRLEIPVPEKLNLGQAFAISNDGRRLVFAGVGADRVPRLWLRDMDSPEVRPLAGTEGFYGPPFLWSPDNRFVIFQSEDKLKKIDVAGGPPQSLGGLRTGVRVGSSWNRGDVILLGSGGNGPIMRMPAAGGPETPVTKPDASRGPSGDLHPWFLPDGKHFLYLRRSSNEEDRGIYAGSIDGKPENQNSRQLVATTVGAIYVPLADSSHPSQGYLLFQRGGTLLAQRFDAERLVLSGEAVAVAEDVGSNLDTGAFSATIKTLVFLRAGEQRGQLTWVDTHGKVLGTVGEPGQSRSLVLSPDGTQAAITKRDGANADIWVIDLARGTNTRLTFGAAMDADPVWSPDGKEIVFRSNRAGKSDLYRKPADGTKVEQLLLKDDEHKIPTSWSRDGRFLLYAVTGPKTKSDLWVLPLTGDPKPRPVVRTEFDERAGVFSPDGRHIAYLSNESGRYEVYVTAFMEDGSVAGRWMISTGARLWKLHWRADSRELDYVGIDSKLMSVEIANTPEFRASAPKAYGEIPENGAAGDFAPDGKRILLPLRLAQVGTAGFTVVLNWQAGLRSGR